MYRAKGCVVLQQLETSLLVPLLHLTFAIVMLLQHGQVLVILLRR